MRKKTLTETTSNRLETHRERDIVCMCVCVCVWERKREIEIGRLIQLMMRVKQKMPEAKNHQKNKTEGEKPSKLLSDRCVKILPFWLPVNISLWTRHNNNSIRGNNNNNCKCTIKRMLTTFYHRNSSIKYRLSTCWQLQINLPNCKLVLIDRSLIRITWLCAFY